MKVNLFINCLAVFCLSFFLIPAPAHSLLIFDNGLINDFSGTEPSGARVRDSSPGDPTTLNVLSGASLGLTEVEDNSLMNVFAGASFTNRIRVFDGASLNLFGGEFVDIDVNDMANAIISGGNFPDSNRQVAGFEDGSITIFGGLFALSIESNADSNIHIISGQFNNEIRAHDNGRVNLLGGQANEIIADNQSVITLYGSKFQVFDEDGNLILDDFGEITVGLDGAISGILADRNELEKVAAFNGAGGSKIVLSQLKCAGDYEPDGDVDGKNLSQLIQFGGVDVEMFAEFFGDNSCIP